ncbi:MAG: hypothetical protein JWN70_2615 [Planctomycetaceae bacterium]|nr:hypothetical protein [Planctomycetaceae bacterium]
MERFAQYSYLIETMNDSPARDSIVGVPLVAISHSPYSEPQFIVEGIGPASFRMHYLSLGNGIVLDLNVSSELTTSSIPANATAGETDGIQPQELLGRPITAVVLDDVGAILVILDGNIFLKDACWFEGNPLWAGIISEHFTPEEREQFTDYWTGQSVRLGDD